MSERRSPYPTRAEVDRVVKSFSDAGGEIGGIEVTRDGTIRVLSKLANAPATSYDRWKQGQLSGN